MPYIVATSFQCLENPAGRRGSRHCHHTAAVYALIASSVSRGQLGVVDLPAESWSVRTHLYWRCTSMLKVLPLAHSATKVSLWCS